jgi:hypothetical protein
MAVIPDWEMGDHDSGRIPASGMADNGDVLGRFFGAGERSASAGRFERGLAQVTGETLANAPLLTPRRGGR